MDRQRMAFFSAASHELKTPVTILKGQLSGMLDGVDVYQDREKYLARSLQVTARMENLIQEILTISRVEAHGGAFVQELVDISEIAKRQLELDTDLIQQRNLRVTVDLCPGLTVKGEPSMLAKAIGNLISNAALYSPEGGEIRIWSGLQQDTPALTIENTASILGLRLCRICLRLFTGRNNPATGARRQWSGALSSTDHPGAASSKLPDRKYGGWRSGYSQF